MDFIRKWIWIVLLSLGAGIKFLSLFPATVEKYYSGSIYPAVSRFLRLLFGWIPFSIGDLFYGAVSVYILCLVIFFLRKIIRKQFSSAYFLNGIRKLLFGVLVVYTTFNLLWGLNYNRLGIIYQLQLSVRPYDTSDLKSLLGLIVVKLNVLDSGARIKRETLQNKKELFNTAVESFNNLAKENSIFRYSAVSIKPSVFSYLGNYLGFTGYYNPFSGEAQINTTVPSFLQPFTTCHEMGHQLGYAKENEANFVGYLSAKSSGDPAFRYSVYFDLYEYAATELYLRDSSQLKPYREMLKPGIRQDFREYRDFLKKYSNPFEPYVRRLYGKYLRSNEQPQGMMTYSEVIAWLIAYQKKYGDPAI